MTIKLAQDPHFERASRILKRFPLLTLFYLLPEEIPRDELQLDFAPRNPVAFIADDFYLTIYAGRVFSRRLMKIWAELMWAAGYTQGFLSDFSKDEPIHILMHDPQTCIKVLSALGYDTDWLATMSTSITGIPFPGEEEAAERLASMVLGFWESEEIKARKIYEVARTHRTHEDFIARKSNVRKDFHRKYYHTRAKNVLVSIQDVWGDVEYVADVEYDLENVIAADWVFHFYKWLGNERDVVICKLRYMGFTQEQIATLLKYKNHSGVNKRIKQIRGILEVYVQWQRELEQDASTPPPPKLLKKNKLLYQPKGKTEAREIPYSVIDFSYPRKNI